jgi:hypothetical protein
MSVIRYEEIIAAIQETNALIDYGIRNDLDKQHEFQKQAILSDKFLTREEKTEALRVLNNGYDRDKVKNNLGTRRICKLCKQKCLATLYCEYCVRNYLKKKFSNWTSGNNDVDNLIQQCQIESLKPDNIIEWIPYYTLQNIKYLTEGGFAVIYTAVWIGGKYEEWNSKEQTLKRFGDVEVALKKLGNVKSASLKWFEEVCKQKYL